MSRDTGNSELYMLPWWLEIKSEVKRERQEKWEWGLTITRDDLENELAGRPTLNQRH